MGELEANHLINRKRGKADVRVPENRIEFLDARGGRLKESVRVGGRGDNVGFIQVILIHIIRRKKSEGNLQGLSRAVILGVRVKGSKAGSQWTHFLE